MNTNARILQAPILTIYKKKRMHGREEERFLYKDYEVR